MPTQRVLCASPEFLTRFPPMTQPDILKDIPCILRQQEADRWSFQTATGVRQTVTPKPGLRVNTMELVHAAACAGRGIALLPSLLAQAEVKSGTLVPVLPNWSADPVLLSLLCRASRLSVPPVAAVRQYILDACNSA